MGSTVQQPAAETVDPVSLLDAILADVAGIERTARDLELRLRQTRISASAIRDVIAGAP